MKKILFITACLVLMSSLVRADDPFAILKDVQNPALVFWKDVVAAEGALAAGNKEAVIKLILKLPARPQYKLSYGEGVYEDLVKRALIVRVLSEGFAAKSVSTKSFTKTESIEPSPLRGEGARRADGGDAEGEGSASDFLSALNAWFPNDDDVTAAVGPERSGIVLSPDWAVQKLHVLYEKNRLKEIRSQIELSDIEAATLSREEKCQSWFELGSALRVDDVRQGEGIGILERVVNGACGDDLTPRALYRLGMTKAGPLDDRRVEFLTKLAKDYPTHRVADDATYLLYKIADEQNDADQKKKYFNTLMSLPAGDMKGALAFELGFEAFQQGDFAEAVKIFRQAADTKPGTDESVPQVRYWLARSLEISGKKTEANKLYAQLVQECPFSFYAILASQRSGVMHKIPRIGLFKVSAPVEANEALSLVDALNGKGLHAAARAVLDLALHTGLVSEEMGSELLAQKMLESQNYRKAIDLASQPFDDTPYGPVMGSSLPNFAALFPDAFDSEIKEISKAVGLKRGLIQGLMREETLFQRSAVSFAGAKGLMQLMPATAALVRKEHGLTSLNSNIIDINTNITLGSTYLKDMVDRFGGNIAYAIMAYNAGPGNVSKWLKRNPNKELDEFIELIPISETRNYVKRVMRSAAVYAAQNGEKLATF